MLKVTCYRSWDELRHLRGDWNVLLQSSASDTVFLSWQWTEAWWKNYGGQRNLFVLVATEGNHIAGIAPLFIDTVHRYGRQWRRLRLIGDGSHDSDYLDMFVAKGCEREAMIAFGEFLKAKSGLWDWIELNGPAQTSPTVKAISEYARETRWRCESNLVPCATLPLARSWEQYLSGLAPRFRTKLRSALAILTNYIHSEPQPCCFPEQIDEWLPVLFDLHGRRWATRGKPGVFGTSVRRRFYSDLSRAAQKEGWLAFYRLNWAERPLAMQYGLVYRNRFHLLQEGYDPDFSDLRPGVALRAWLMCHWIESSLEEYDFLAGASDYKFEWGAREKHSLRMVITADPISAFVASDIPRFRGRVRETFSRSVPWALLSWRAKMLARRNSHNWGTIPVASGWQRGREIRIPQLVSAAYSSTPIGRWSRFIASRYVWVPRTGNKLGLRRRAQPVCQIFQYHRINDDRDPFLAALPTETFRAQMQYLAANFPLMTLDQLARGDFQAAEPYSVAVTFDDGYRDSFVCAFPILKELRIPATVFLATGYIDNRALPWYDQVRLAFKLTTRSKFEVERISGEGIEAKQGDFQDMSTRARLAERVLRWLRGMPEYERKHSMNEVFRALAVPVDLNLPNQMLRWEEVRQMAACGISFGAHTVNHPVLSKISDADMRREILVSKKTIENRLQKPVAHFAYPFGQPPDFNAQTKIIIQESGFKTAVTTVWGLNEPTADPYELRRFTPWRPSIADFRLQLDWYRFSNMATAPSNGQAHFRGFGKKVS
jgi:CelD/BcsL family acetyltransferase involved in cellulose biosynthesis/peptidoglycan/xylan/chitin deacetylase (PgdA/CDA1 family)